MILIAWNSEQSFYCEIVREFPVSSRASDDAFMVADLWPLAEMDEENDELGE